MKILHVIADLDPAYGGPPMIAFRLAAAQAGLGHDVSMVHYSDGRGDADFAAATREVPSRERVRLISLTKPGLLERTTAFAARRELKQHFATTRYDALHLHNVWDPLLLVSAREARRQKLPYWVLLNGMLDPWSLAQKRLKKRVALEVAYRRMLDGAFALHVGNRDEQELIRPLGLKARTVMLPNGVFPEEFEPLPAAGSFRASHPELGDRPFVLFLSRLHYKKGLDYLVGAFAELSRRNPEVELVIAGPDEGERKPTQDLVQKHGLESRVHFTGPLYGRKKLEALVDAACFCLPSRQEGFSMAILEALACATPVVISENCHFPEVGTTGSGQVVPLELPAIVAALARVFSEPEATRRMGQRGRELLFAEYTWKIVAERSIAAYQAAL
jgi:glycosyltransferase involved in cell wall biosynthesis